MKWIVVTAALLANGDPGINTLAGPYSSIETCREVSTALNERIEGKSFCIQAGEDDRDAMFDQFFKMVDKLNQMQYSNDNKTHTEVNK